MTPPAVVNPLWVISLFLGISEICVTTAAALTDGFVQILFAVFAVAFATCVAATFFVILWKKNHVLYAPRDFGTASSPDEFVRAMRSTPDRRLEEQDKERGRRDEVTDEAVRKALQEVVSVLLEGEAPTGAHNESEIQQIQASVVETLRAARRQSEVRIDLEEIDPTLKVPLVLTVQHDTTVQELLDLTYFAIEEFVPMFSYGDAWVLEEAPSGRRFSNMGSSYREAEGGGADTRRLEDVGIRPGMRLRALRRG